MQATVEDIADGFAAVILLYLCWRVACIMASRITAWFLAPVVIRDAELLCKEACQ